VIAGSLSQAACNFLPLLLLAFPVKNYSQLKQWNHLKTDVIQAGKTLYVKKPATQAAASSSKKHIVRSGETLSAISKKYAVSRSF
jgi:hypothetical protein